ncbi:MAG: DNA-3-methyladenine glycosylase [Candidatus Sulfotelmatobacter sp.]|nr:DNA-3-methyladenine glycosylase [Candidatus Sulfotelmatobacter sp.]
MQFGPPEFQSLAEAIVYQQLNGKAAETIFKRFAALAGEPLTPQGILELSDQQMRGAGLSKQKSAYLRDLATKTADGSLDFTRLRCRMLRSSST